jgi:hypothetical protein
MELVIKIDVSRRESAEVVKRILAVLWIIGLEEFEQLSTERWSLRKW